MDEKKTPKIINLLLRILIFLITLALIAGALFLVANRDKLSMDAVKRYFTYRSLERSDSGQAESFDYSPSATDVFAAVENDLLVCSNGGVRLYSGGGVCYVEEAIALEAPAVEVCGNTAAVWSVGGDTVYVYRDRARFGELTGLEGAILSVRLNPSGWLAVTTKGSSGYKAISTIYDEELKQRMAFRLSTSFVTDAVVTEDCASLAVVSMDQSGTSFESTLSLYTLPGSQDVGVHYDQTPAETHSLGNNVILDTAGRSSVWCVGDTGLSVFRDHTVGNWSFQEQYLKTYAFADEFAAVLVGKYRAGSQAELVTVDANGNPSAARALNEQVLSLSASGKYVAVLTADRLDIYTQDLEPYASLNGTSGAQKVLMRDDGTALLIGAVTAHLYVPTR